MTKFVGPCKGRCLLVAVSPTEDWVVKALDGKRIGRGPNGQQLF